MSRSAFAAIDTFPAGHRDDQRLSRRRLRARPRVRHSGHSETASFGQPEINLGIIPGGGGTQRLTRLVGEGRGDGVDPHRRNHRREDCIFDRLNRHVFPADELQPKTMEIAHRIAEKSPIALQLAKEAVKLASRSNLDEGLRREIDLFALCFSTEDKDEGVSAFLEKRKAAFKGR